MDSIEGQRPLLLLFAKVPAPGRVKTRLCPPLAPEQAAALYAAFLRDIVDATPEACDARLCVWPSEEADAMDAGLWARAPMRAQRGADLAARMAHAIEEAFEEGAGTLLLRNTDSPDLAPARVTEAIEAIADGADLVLGPDEGGGYYLIAARAWRPEIADVIAAMRDVSAEEVFAATIARARALGFATFVLPRAADIDIPEDLARLRERLRQDPERAPATARALHELDV